MTPPKYESYLNQELFHKRAIMLGSKWIGQNISWVVFSSNVCQYYHTCSYRLPNLMICNIILLLIEGSRVNGSTGRHTFIISHHLVWSINRNSEHCELVEYFHGQLRGNFHGYQILDVGWFSTVLSHLLYHWIGVLLRNMNTPVTNRLVSWSYAWSASEYLVILTGLPFGYGMSIVIYSIASGYSYDQLISI